MTSPANYAHVNGLNMYYELHGEGSPLVLLHGALSTIDVNFSKILPTLAQHHRIIAIEQQGHGHTADIDRPMSFAQMADDTAALLHLLGIEQADFFGYSLGGGIAVELAIHHPGLVRKFTFAGGTSFSTDGFYPEVMENIGATSANSLDGTPFQAAYLKVAPHPENWAGLIEKVTDMDMRSRGWTPEQIRSIQAPSLLIIGDSDLVRPEHTTQMFRLLGGGDMTGTARSQLAVLPGTTHLSLVDRADWLVTMTEAFLAA